MAERLVIFDTTLRDGEQAPGFSMRIDEKVRMAKQLAEVLGREVATPAEYRQIMGLPAAAAVAVA